MKQPNFVQIEWKMRRVIAFCEARPTLPSSTAYIDQTRSAAEEFEQATRRTDATYTRWRDLLAENLRAYKQARESYLETQALCDEHAYDEAPTGDQSYLEEEAIEALIRKMIAFLETKSGEWDWVDTKASDLRRHLDQAAVRAKDQDKAYAEYVASARSRRRAYDRAVGAVKDYLRDARRDAPDDDELEQIAF